MMWAGVVRPEIPGRIGHSELEFYGAPTFLQDVPGFTQNTPLVTHQGPCQGTFAVCGQLLKDSWSLVAVNYFPKEN